MKKALVLAVIFAALLQISGCAGKVSANTVFSENDLTGKRIGVVKGTAATVCADGRGTLHTYEAAETMLVDLRNGVLDCAVMDEPLAKTMTKKVSGLKILQQRLFTSDFCFAIAKENPDLLEAVNTALQELSESGMLDKIIEGYTPGNDFRYQSPDNLDLSHGTLTLAVDAAMPPYSFYDDNKQPTGLHIDIARAVCDILHVKLKVAVVPAGNMIVTVQYGKADIALGGANSEDNAKLVIFSNPYTTCTQVIVTRR